MTHNSHTKTMEQETKKTKRIVWRTGDLAYLNATMPLTASVFRNGEHASKRVSVTPDMTFEVVDAHKGTLFMRANINGEMVYVHVNKRETFLRRAHNVRSDGKLLSGMERNETQGGAS